MSIRKIQTRYLREAELFLVISVFKMIPWLPITTLRGVFIQFPKLHKGKKGIGKMAYFSVAPIFQHYFYYFSSHFGLEEQRRIHLFSKALKKKRSAFMVYNILYIHYHICFDLSKSGGLGEYI